MGYPAPSRESYLVLKVEPETAPEFDGLRWDFRKLANYKIGRGAALPFTASLSELMKNKDLSSP